MLLCAFATSAAKIYFQNTLNWSGVYAYTWSPSDEPTVLDPLKSVTIEKEKGGTITLFVKDTDKDNIISLNKSSYLAKDKQETNQIKVKDGAVYNGSSTQIGKVTEIDGKAIYQELDNPVVPNSGVFLAAGSVWQQKEEFVKTGLIYTIKNITISSNCNIKIYYANEDGSETQVGPLENYLTVSKGTTESTVAENNNCWRTGSLQYYYDIVFDAENNTVTFTQLPVVLWGILRSDSGVWGTPMLLPRVNPDAAIVNYTFNATGDSQFYLFYSYGEQSWNEGTRLMPVGNADVVGDFSGKMKTGNTSCWLLDNEVPFGTWTVDAAYSAQDISFKRTVQAIIVNSTPAQLNDGSWTGALNEDDFIRFNINGTYYTLGELGDGVQNGTDMVYTTTLDKLDSNEAEGNVIGISAEDATVKVDGDIVTVTVVGAVIPQMTVGDRTIDLMQSGNFLVAYDIEITNSDAISFNINGKKYVPEMPETIAYESYSVTIPLKQEDASASFADVKSKQLKGGEIAFITDAFRPNIRVNSDASAVTFIWDTMTGIDTIESDCNCEAVYYNLQGIRVVNPQNGIFIEVKEGKAIKVQK